MRLVRESTLGVLIALWLITSGVAFAQTPGNNTAPSMIQDELLLDLMNDQKDTAEALARTEVLVEENADDAETRFDQIEEQITSIRDEARIIGIASILGGVLAVFGSGYLGYHIHKREFNAELAGLHLDEIKSKILAPYRECMNRLKDWSHPYGNIYCPTVEEILEFSTLDYSFILRTWQNKTPLPTEWQTLNAELMRDMIDNHYPKLGELHQSCVVNANRCNEQIKMTVPDVVNLLRPLVEAKCEIADERTGFGSSSQSRFSLAAFAENLVQMSAAKFKESDYEIFEHHNGMILAVSSPERQQTRFVYPKHGAIDECKALIRDCVHAFYSDAEIHQKIAECIKRYDEFNKSIDACVREIDRISSKTVINFKKRFYLFQVSCDYVRP